MYKNTEVDLLGEKWKVIFLPKVLHDNKPVRAGVIRDKKTVLLATRDSKGKALPEDVLKETLTRTLVPIVIEIKVKQDGIQ